MNKESLFVPALLLLGLFSLGVLIGINLVDDSDDVIEITDSNHYPVSQPPVAFYSDEPLATTETTPPDDTFSDEDSSQSLEDKVADLEARIFELEQALASKPEVKTITPISRVENRFNRLNNLQTKQSLIKAGINEIRADEIIRSRNDLELKKLELSDRATREDYIDSNRYVSEYSALVADETTLREELGDDDYDRYLYTNGQMNRVKATSVIIGSAADLAGMRDGDLIVNYAQYRIFDWNELKQATTEGVSGEYVNVDIVRDRQLMSLSVPRGPLGVRLGMARILP